MAEEKWIINISVKKKTPSAKGNQPVARLTREAYDLVADLSKEMGIPFKQVASQIILQASEHMELNKVLED